MTTRVGAVQIGALAMLIGIAGYLRPRARRTPQTSLAFSFGTALRHRTTGLMAARYAIAVLISGAIPTATGLGHPYWAMVAAVAALAGNDTRARLIRAGHRIFGTLLGIVVAAGLLAIPMSPLAMLGVVVVLQIGAELLVGRNYGLALLFVTPLALLMVALAHPVDPWLLLRDRGLETVLGAVIGIAITLLAHRRQTRPIVS